MVAPITPSALLPLAAALAALLVAGVACGIHLATASRPSVGNWKDRMRDVAASSSWDGRDALWLLLCWMAARAIRVLLPAGLMWDLLLVQGALLGGLAWRSSRQPRPPGAPLPWRAAAAHAAVRWLAILPLAWFAAFIWQVMLRVSGHTPELQAAVRMFMETPEQGIRVALILSAVVVAPVVEEILFRGILLPLAVRRMGAVAGVALTSLAFAALHADLGSFLALLILSVAFSLAYARTGSLRVPIVMHMLFNGVNLALLFLFVRAGAV